MGRFTARSLFAAFAIFTSSFFTFPGMGAEKEIAVSLEHIRYNVTIPGDNLTKLSGRFGVPIKDVLEANPQVAARTHPERRHWLYLGERILVPVYVPEVKYTTAVSDDAMVAVPMGVVREKDTKIATLQKELNDSVASIASVATDVENQKALVEKTKKALQTATTALESAETKITELQKKNDKLTTDFVVFFLLVAAIVALLILSRAFNSRKDPGALQKETFGTPSSGKTDSTKNVSETRPETAVHAPDKAEAVDSEKLAYIFQNVTGKELEKFIKTPVTKDECGNPVMIANLVDFMNHPTRAGIRQELENHTIAEWREIIKAHKEFRTRSAQVAAE